MGCGREARKERPLRDGDREAVHAAWKHADVALRIADFQASATVRPFESLRAALSFVEGRLEPDATG